MKNLFIINEEEKKRILNLHESASKRQYLSEQEYKSTIGGVTMVVDKDGKQLRAFNLDTDENLVDWSSRFSGQSQPTKGKKATDPIPPVTYCPVGKGTKKEVEAFQTWLDTKSPGWVPKYPEGLKGDPKKGFGMCGPNTKKAWAKSGGIYMKELGSPESLKSVEVKTIGDTQAEPELKLSTPSTSTTPTSTTGTTPPKETLAQQKAAPNIDNNIE